MSTTSIAWRRLYRNGGLGMVLAVGCGDIVGQTGAVSFAVDGDCSVAWSRSCFMDILFQCIILCCTILEASFHLYRSLSSASNHICSYRTPLMSAVRTRSSEVLRVPAHSRHRLIADMASKSHPPFSM